MKRKDSDTTRFICGSRTVDQFTKERASNRRSFGCHHLLGLLFLWISVLSTTFPFSRKDRMLRFLISQTRPVTAITIPNIVGLVAFQSTSTFVSAFATSAPPTPTRQLHPRSFASSRNRLFSTKSNSFAVPDMGTNDHDFANKTHSGYEKWVRRLYATNMFHPVKLGLDNMRQLHALLGSPMDDPDRAVVHVAGTNGKGSVCLKIANTLQQQPGNVVGLFCSPHVSSFRERMQVNGEMITEEEVVELLPKIYDLCVEHDIPATFFEITTALAFTFYAKRNANVIVLETGLGGRLDATNVIGNPALTVITSIGLEHTRILGDTIELIAREKGGIIKRGVPVLVGPHCPHEVLQQCAKEKGGGPYYVPSLVFGTLSDFAQNTENDIADYDLENQDIAKASLDLLKKSHPDIMTDLTTETIEHGTLVRPSCRFERFQRADSTVILDVAHNPPAMEYLVRKLETTFPDASFRFVCGMSSDKDLKQCSDALLSISEGDASRVHLVEAAHPRAAKLEAILEAEPALEKIAQYDLEDRSITRQVQQALSLAQKNGEVLVVCGSVFLMAEAREALGFQEPRDSDYIAEMAGAGIRHNQENFGNTVMDESDDTTSKQQHHHRHHRRSSSPNLQKISARTQANSSLASTAASKAATKLPQLYSTISSFRAFRRSLQPSVSIGFVPTMGALHEGHLSLVKEARKHNDIVIASVFVNPTQFGEGEDFDKYPRQLERDLELLGGYNVDHLFAPSIEDMYGKDHAAFVQCEGFEDIPEGVSRPGHFRGVATIVTKLFNVVQPTNAYFGQKDAAQCVLIQRVVEDLNMDLNVVVMDTIREEDGLAKSSRNAYLSDVERQAAPVVYRSLQAAKELYQSNPSVSSSELISTTQNILQSEPLVQEIQYISVDSKTTMKPISQPGREDGAVISLAVKVGSVRLIDNIIL